MSVDVPSTSRIGAIATPFTSASHSESATRWIKVGSTLMSLLLLLLRLTGEA